MNSLIRISPDGKEVAVRSYEVRSFPWHIIGCGLASDRAVADWTPASRDAAALVLRETDYERSGA